MKKLLYALLALVLIGTIVYFLGPKPNPPKVLDGYSFKLSNNLADLEKQIDEKEKTIKGLKPDNQARIIWADTTKKERTKVALLYIHGFSASQEEGDPVASNLAKKYGANLYLARLAEHGIDIGDSTMQLFKAENAIESAEEALEIAKRLGEEVHVIGTSFGGALTLYLASKHPEIKSIVLYSPCIKVFDPTAELLDNPWGLQIAHQVTGKEHNDITPKNDMQPKYWAMHYRLEALVELQNFLTNLMTKETFEKVKCPTFLGYYYKDEEHQDKVVSVPALLEMYEQLSSTDKQKVAFPNANNHVLASYVLSEDYQTVQDATDKFLSRVIQR
jgi:esterase/lipase